MKQLSVFVENKVGSLAQVTGALKTAGINLRAISSFDSPSYGILRIVVDQPEKAWQLLHGQKFAVKLTEVIAVELQDRPGALDDMLTILTEANISINYIYSFVLQEQAAPLMVLHVSDMKKAEQALEAAGMHIAG